MAKDRIPHDVDRRDQGPDRRGHHQVPEGGAGPPEAQAGDRAGAPRPRRHPAVPRRGSRAEGHARHRLQREGPPVGAALALQRARRGRQGAPLARGVRVRHRQGERAGGDPEADPERDREAGGAHAHAQAQNAMNLRMPAESAPHERTIMCWPARESMWQERFGRAEADYAAVANAIAAFEPVLMVADPRFAAQARRLCGAGVEVVELPLDDSWARDSGPIFVTDGHGERAGVQFGFNGWGEKFAPYDDDARFATRVLELLGEQCRDATHMILEGGSIAVDGEGTLITTEQCLFEEHRNPRLGRSQIEAELRAQLGVEHVVWLGVGLVEDDDTDGHVDNICAVVEPGRVVLQTVRDEASPNFEHCQENLRRLDAAGLDVVELPWLPYVRGEEPPVVVPYTNFYLCNGGLIAPVTGKETDAEALALLESLYPGREAVAVPGETLALGGGGVHCITQQVPAA